jgi:hypothetical protein
MLEIVRSLTLWTSSYREMAALHSLIALASTTRFHYYLPVPQDYDYTVKPKE